jgi:RHS repeat-associated protein
MLERVSARVSLLVAALASVLGAPALPLGVGLALATTGVSPNCAQRAAYLTLATTARLNTTCPAERRASTVLGETARPQRRGPTNEPRPPTARTRERGQPYYWAGDDLLAESRKGSLTEYAKWGFVAEALWENGKLRHVVNSQQGVPQELLDEDGKLVWQGTFDDWGKLIEENGTTTCRLRLPGQIADDETGLHYNRFRYYSPEAGQFVSADPIGFEGGTNEYRFAPTSLNWVDPLGLRCKASGCHIKGKVSQKQLRHVENRPEWIARGQGSYLKSVDDAQKVLDAYHSGSAAVLGRTSQGHVVVSQRRHRLQQQSRGWIHQPTDERLPHQGNSKPKHRSHVAHMEPLRNQWNSTNRIARWFS